MRKAEMKLRQRDVEQRVGQILAIETFLERIVDRGWSAVRIDLNRDPPLRATQYRQPQFADLNLFDPVLRVGLSSGQ